MAYTDIDKSDEYFNSVLYAGNSGTQSITGVNFQPDFLWIKRRTLAGDNNLVDVIRTSDKTLISNATVAEYSNATITSFDSDGFSLSGTDGALNASGSNYVAWNWLAGGTGVSNTQGSIASTVSANTTSGFSIVSYTGNGTGGATVGHGLGQKPACIIVKRRSASMNWGVYHQSLASNEILQLDVTNAVYTGSGVFNATQPTASVFYLGSGTAIDNDSGSTYIAYCFAEKKGFSKFGSYTGNNSSDGTFVYTGFKPAFILVKTTNTTQWWTLLDNKRDTYNVATLGISPNSSNSESTFNTDRGPHNMDFVSNGLKIRTDNSGINGTNSFIYMAFAENPFVTSTSVPTTAR
jgi:hypothetical protein